MEEQTFDFSAAFNNYEDRIGQITKSYINEIKAEGHLEYEDMTSLITTKAVELEGDLLNEAYQFSSLCIDSTANERLLELRTTEPIFLKNYVLSLNKPKLKQLMSFYDYEAEVILRKYNRD